MAHNQLSWNVLLFSCNPIGQLCLSCQSYSSHTVKLCSLRLTGYVREHIVSEKFDDLFFLELASIHLIVI